MEKPASNRAAAAAAQGELKRDAGGRGRGKKRKDMDHNEDDEADSSISVEEASSQPLLSTSQVLKLVVKSNMLSTADLGRLLLFTSKSISATAASLFASADGDDEEDGQEDGIWQALCFCKWQDSASTLIEATGFGNAETCFRKFMDLDVSRRLWRVPALQFSPAEYLLFVNILSVTDSEKRTLFSKVIRGETVPEFFEKGQFKVDLGENGFHLWTTPDGSPITTGYNNQRDDIVADNILLDEMQLDLVRLTDQRCVRLMSRTDHEVDEFVVKENGEVNVVEHLTTGTCYDLSRATSLLAHCGRSVDSLVVIDVKLDYRLSSKNEPNDSIELSGFAFSSELSNGDDFTDFMDLIPEHMQNRVGGITFAHFLEVAAWDHSAN